MGEEDAALKGRETAVAEEKENEQVQKILWQMLPENQTSLGRTLGYKTEMDL